MPKPPDTVMTRGVPLPAPLSAGGTTGGRGGPRGSLPTTLKTLLYLTGGGATLTSGTYNHLDRTDLAADLQDGVGNMLDEDQVGTTVEQHHDQDDVVKNTMLDDHQESTQLGTSTTDEHEQFLQQQELELQQHAAEISADQLQPGQEDEAEDVAGPGSAFVTTTQENRSCGGGKNSCGGSSRRTTRVNAKASATAVVAKAAAPKPNKAQPNLSPRQTSVVKLQFPQPPPRAGTASRIPGPALTPMQLPPGQSPPPGEYPSPELQLRPWESYDDRSTGVGSDWSWEEEEPLDLDDIDMPRARFLDEDNTQLEFHAPTGTGTTPGPKGEWLNFPPASSSKDPKETHRKLLRGIDFYLQYKEAELLGTNWNDESWSLWDRSQNLRWFELGEAPSANGRGLKKTWCFLDIVNAETHDESGNQITPPDQAGQVAPRTEPYYVEQTSRGGLPIHLVAYCAADERVSNWSEIANDNRKAAVRFRPVLQFWQPAAQTSDTGTWKEEDRADQAAAIRALDTGARLSEVELNAASTALGAVCFANLEKMEVFASDRENIFFSLRWKPPFVFGKVGLTIEQAEKLAADKQATIHALRLANIEQEKKVQEAKKSQEAAEAAGITGSTAAQRAREQARQAISAKEAAGRRVQALERKVDAGQDKIQQLQTVVERARYEQAAAEEAARAARTAAAGPRPPPGAGAGQPLAGARGQRSPPVGDPRTSFSPPPRPRAQEPSWTAGRRPPPRTSLGLAAITASPPPVPRLGGGGRGAAPFAAGPSGGARTVARSPVLQALYDQAKAFAAGAYDEALEEMVKMFRTAQGVYLPNLLNFLREPDTREVFGIFQMLNWMNGVHVRSDAPTWKMAWAFDMTQHSKLQGAFVFMGQEILKALNNDPSAGLYLSRALFASSGTGADNGNFKNTILDGDGFLGAEEYTQNDRQSDGLTEGTKNLIAIAQGDTPRTSTTALTLRQPYPRVFGLFRSVHEGASMLFGDDVAKGNAFKDADFERTWNFFVRDFDTKFRTKMGEGRKPNEIERLEVLCEGDLTKFLYNAGRRSATMAHRGGPPAAATAAAGPVSATGAEQSGITAQQPQQDFVRSLMEKREALMGLVDGPAVRGSFDLSKEEKAKLEEQVKQIDAKLYEQLGDGWYEKLKAFRRASSFRPPGAGAGTSTSPVTTAASRAAATAAASLAATADARLAAGTARATPTLPGPTTAQLPQWRVPQQHARAEAEARARAGYRAAVEKAGLAFERSVIRNRLMSGDMCGFVGMSNIAFRRKACDVAVRQLDKEIREANEAAQSPETAISKANIVAWSAMGLDVDGPVVKFMPGTKILDGTILGGESLAVTIPETRAPQSLKQCSEHYFGTGRAAELVGYREIVLLRQKYLHRLRTEPPPNAPHSDVEQFGEHIKWAQDAQELRTNWKRAGLRGLISRGDGTYQWMLDPREQAASSAAAVAPQPPMTAAANNSR
ncbi:unnamed protein product, partial [Amoebophrya sp. A120]|eukprot:GSA120T00010053001.1